ncbi:type ISP restriction/modification enzyme [Aquibium microcysteis]|uniref:type ISP restriction/modification enzyme n=1 Tax=Aquibium microcysteis TaxID=675281 RepID=UPI00165CF6EC|nr:type ISP restriction/modification enzyme [Aquibium microcysteis]
MSQLLVQNYLNEIDRIRKYSGVVNEQVLRPAFRRLLDHWATAQRLVFLEEFPFPTTQKTTVYPDATILHDIRVPLGYWEAKDTRDDLDEEIRKKFVKGYPQDNILFENSETAVLIQNRQEVTRCSMVDTEALLKLLNLFFGYERQEIAEFRKAVQKFRDDLPAVLDALRERIDAAYDRDSAFRAAAQKFLEHCKDTINPTLGEADVREMLIQHILTEEIFNHVFDQGDFHRENNIAKELYALEGKFFTGQVKRETLKALETYYAAIRANAAQITSHHEKQTFLKVVYENFYKVYNPKAADRLGVVYTPNEIVKFMIEGADWLCQKHFGKALIDEHVEILDPATGTGTFICELLEHFRGQPQKLAHKYKSELHANEVAILPYYVANLNIEATYAAISGQFAEFSNLCFVDTLDNVHALGIKTGQHVGDLFGALSEENVERVKRQNARKISVVIGNPPYNANQQNENENNNNRAYPHVDQLIKGSYIKLSTAQKTKVYDMYARFFRWASDRLHDDGVLAFVTNRSFIDSRTFDGFRRAVANEFNEIYVMDLGGDVRANPKLSGTKNNVFGIQTGVAISFMVKRHKQKGCRIFYARRPELDTAEDKLSFLASSPASGLAWQRVEPDRNANWVNLTENDWDQLIQVADKRFKTSGNLRTAKSIFVDYSMGYITARDQWVVGEDNTEIEPRVRQLINTVNLSDLTDRGSTDIKWSRTLLRIIESGRKLDFEAGAFRKTLYRPFVRRQVYFGSNLVEMPNKMPAFFEPGPNLAIFFNDPGARAPFSPLASDLPAEFHLAASSDGFQGLPRYRYTSTLERIDNITDWALKQFREAYGKDGRGAEAAISPTRGEIGRSAAASSRREIGKSRKARAIGKDDIFQYVYAVLHDPVYRERYAINLKREFPRIPFYSDFWRWAAWGERLMTLHIGYEAVEPWPLTRADTPDEKAREAGVAPKAMLKADRDNGMIRLDSETTLSGIPKQAWDYRLGNRSGLDWILDQYREKTPKDPTIREKFNTYRFADYKEKVVDLLMRVTRVSVETVAITDAMREAKR